MIFDLVVTRMSSHSKIRQILHSATCSSGRCHFHRYHSYPEAESRRHWLAEAGETPAFDRFQSDYRSDDHPANFANWLMQSICRHSLSEADPDSVGFVDAAAVLASLLDVTVADAERESAERLVDLPI